MTAKNARVGRGKCPTCGHGVIFRRSPSGKITFACDECDSYGYADKASNASERWIATIEGNPDAAARAPSSAPAPAPKGDGFTLEGL